MSRVSLSLTPSTLTFQLITCQMTSCVCCHLLIDSHRRLHYVDHHWHPQTRDCLHLHLRGVSLVSLSTSGRSQSQCVFLSCFVKFFFCQIFIILLFFLFHIFFPGCYSLTNVTAFMQSHSDWNLDCWETQHEPEAAGGFKEPARA